jgi:phenylacetate-CoA ligase
VQFGARALTRSAGAKKIRPVDLAALYRDQVSGLFERSTFYRAKLEQAGFTGDAAADLSRIAELPFTTKDELRQSQLESPPLGSHVAVPLEEVARVYSTSGTSGTPCYIPLTRRDLEEWRRIARDSYGRSGLGAGQRLVTTYNAGPFVAGAALEAFDALGVTHLPVGTGNTERLVTALRLFRPQALICTPSYAEYIAEWASEHGFDVAAAGLSRLIVAGEPGGGEEQLRRRLEQRYGARVYEVMGIGDVAASLWGECPEQSGMHFSGEGAIHVELIDPASGEPVAWQDGATGELVYTHLCRQAAPLLRFRSGDQVVVWSTVCACGRSLPRVRCIGRSDDMLIVRGVNVFPSAVRDVVGRFQPRVSGVISVRPRGDGVKQDPPLPVLVELAPGETPDPALAAALAAEIRSALAFSPEVMLVAAGTLPRSEYKRKLIDRS